MHKFPIANYQRFSQLPLSEFDNVKFSIYILSFDWYYLFINQLAASNLSIHPTELLGKNMWARFPKLATDPNFLKLKKNLEDNIATNFVTVSPLTSLRLNISGVRLEDCFYCTSCVLPNKVDLLEELRSEIGKSRKTY